MSTDNRRNMEIRQEIVAFISEFNRVNGYSPTVREVGKAVGLKSSSSALFHIRALESEGVISGGGVPRSLVVKEGCDRETVVQRICIDLDDVGKMNLDCTIKKPKGANIEISLHRVYDEV